MALRGNKRVTVEALGVANWKFPDEGAFSGAIYDSYTARKQAVNLYFEGATDEVIKSEAGLSLSQTYKLIKNRCMATHPDGEVWGWRGLIPNLRINGYQRKQKIQIDQFGFGSTGVLKSLFNQYPGLREKFEKRILNASKATKLGLVNRNNVNHFHWFLRELRILGLEEQNAWPFNTEKLGYVTISKYIKSLYEQHPSKAALITGGVDALKKLSSGDGNARPVEHFFQRVEMDAHKIDGRFSVSIPQPTGGHAHKIVHRLWVVVIMEIVSRAVLGYHLSMRREVSKIDVLRAIKMALTVWKKPRITFGDHAYLFNANLPSAVSEEYVGLCWDETSVDGALAETCKTVEKVLENVVGSKLLHPKNSFSVRRNKDDRPFIEAFFRHLGSWGFQQLGNTTGSSPKTKPKKKSRRNSVDQPVSI
ncbi:hypothetical protein O59_004060 [Cellvibrio sp. BR]|uniref:hypothetical protein n=1 Tax=Cellvibrio sp. BR TaxID=1134474 RepID=UPI0002600971|nr:hypothetical protein [Cellvibrio sp. BR]EIK43267.1 hypothetical protein O59_004060 [Cellvibrio sp. BR]